MLATRANENLQSKAPAPAAVEAVVDLAGRATTHELLLAIWSRIEADAFLAETMGVLHEISQSGKPYWDMCCALAAYTSLHRPRAYLEIGVRQGRSACVVAALQPDVDLYLFDMWHPDYAGVANPGPQFVREQLQRVGHRGRVYFGTGRSQETVPDFVAKRDAGGQFPLMTVDGDHRDAGALADLRNVVDHVAVGGMLVFDDIRHPTYPTLHGTWREFLQGRPELVSIENTRDGTGTALAFRVNGE